MADYVESMLEAMQTIADSAVSSLSYDKTLLCLITDNSNKAKGEYTVSDGSVTFTAYTEKVNYAINTWVYVTIPEGDYNNKKFITGRYVSDENEYYTYQAPLDTYVDITENIFPSDLSTSLLANGDKTSSIEEIDKLLQLLIEDLSTWGETEYSTTVEKNEAYDSIINKYNTDMSNIENNTWALTNLLLQGYDRLGISAEFMTWLEEAKSGDYGLSITVGYLNSVDDNKSLKLFKTLKLSISDMYGNPYLYETYIKLEAVFNVTNMPIITDIIVGLYLLKNFKDEDEEYIPTTYINELDELEYTLEDNIFVQNIYISLGYDLNTFNEDKLFIYSFDEVNYSSSDSEEDRLRNVKLRWIHKEDDNILNMDSIPDDGKSAIYWYRYNVRDWDESLKDNYAGNFWIKQSDYTNHFEFNFTCSSEVQDEFIKAIVVTPTQSALDAYIAGQEELDELYAEDSESYQDRLEEIEEAYNTAGLDTIEEQIEFNNTTKVDVYTAIDLINSLTIKCTDDYNGVYNIYKSDGEIQNLSETYVNREFELSYNSILTGLTNYDGDEIVTWYIPKENTMIAAPRQGYEYKDTDIFIETDDYYIISREVRNAAELEGESGEEQYAATTLIYRIKNYYLTANSNNLVKCELLKNDMIYTTEKDLVFGTSGSNGTDYTFKLSFVGDNKYSLGLEDSILILAKLYDYNGEDITDNLDKVSYSWMYDSSFTFELVSNLLVTITSPTLMTKYCNILKASTRYDGKKLETFIEIPYSMDNLIYNYIAGADKIIYGSDGSSPSYYKSSYQIYNIDGRINEEVEWSIKIDEVVEEEDYLYYPTLSELNCILPLSMYIKDLDPCYIACTSNGSIVWAQPLYIGQNRYESSLLNSWDGSLTIDEENGTILTTMIGAGKKNSDNTFSGVLIGDIQDAYEVTKTGVYGYDSGILSFKLTEDGKAVFGASGKGQIRIDGNYGTIESGNYKVTSGNAGMSIDLCTGSIDSYSFTLSSKNVNISSNTNYKRIVLVSSDDPEAVKYTSNKYYYLKEDTDTEEHLSGFVLQTKAESSMTVEDYKNIYYQVSEWYSISGSELKDYIADTYYYLNADGDYKLDSSSSGDVRRTYYKLTDNVYEEVQIYFLNKYYTLNRETYVLSALSRSNYTTYYYPAAYETVVFSTYIPGTYYCYNASTLQYEKEAEDSVFDENKVYYKINNTDYFNIQDNASNMLMRVSDNKFYLASSDYSANSKGFKIDIKNGEIYAYENFKLITHHTITTTLNDVDLTYTGFLKINTNNDYPIQVGIGDSLTFKVSYAGVCEAKNLIATGGKIGGWYITSNGLVSIIGGTKGLGIALDPARGIIVGVLELATDYSTKEIERDSSTTEKAKEIDFSSYTVNVESSYFSVSPTGLLIALNFDLKQGNIAYAYITDGYLGGWAENSKWANNCNWASYADKAGYADEAGAAEKALYAVTATTADNAKTLDNISLSQLMSSVQNMINNHTHTVDIYISPHTHGYWWTGFGGSSYTDSGGGGTYRGYSSTANYSGSNW